MKGSLGAVSVGIGGRPKQPLNQTPASHRLQRQHCGEQLLADPVDDPGEPTRRKQSAEAGRREALRV
ncbi:MAG: hypothetical protein AAFV53_05825 [Myxococcota bacterium]